VVFSVFASATGVAFCTTVNPLVAQMLAYAGFAIGYFVRPVGGIVLGHFGDHVGRRTCLLMLVLSLVTLAIGLLPTKLSGQPFREAASSVSQASI
jgi:MFS family permease